jgi:RNA polymerase sigma-70 factor, ECF subfamily
VGAALLRFPAEATEMGDKELIDALRRGQNSAWAELVDRYIRLVHHVVRKAVPGFSHQDVEDITHDLFQSLVTDDYRVLGTIEAPYDLKAWLAISARRRAIDFARKRKLAPVPLDGSTIAAPEETAPAETSHAVSESLAILNDRERQVVQLFYLDGKKYREIAHMTGIPMNSISPTLVRAVEKMQKYLTDRKLT